MTFTDILLGVIAVFVLIKCSACLGSVWLIITRSTQLCEALIQDAPRDEIRVLYLPLRPLHSFVDNHLSGQASKLAEKAIKGPVVVTIGSVTTVLCASGSRSWDGLVLILGIATAACAVLHLVLAFVESLAFGRRTRMLFHVAVPSDGRLTFIRNWSVVRDGNNLLTYFLGLLYMLVIGFTALSVGINAVDPQGFAIRGEASDVSWLYFSIATIATLGDSDISPRSTFAQVAVISQIAMGPLLLSWLLAVFTGTESHPRQYGTSDK